MTLGRPASIRTVSGGTFTSIIVCFMMLSGECAGTFAAGADEGGAFARDAYYELSIAPENATRSVNPSTSVKSAAYAFEARNLGDSGMPPCDLVLSPWSSTHDGWSYNFIPSLPASIPSGGSAKLLLVIYPAADAEARRYTFQLQGKSGVPSNSITIHLDVLQYAGVLVRAPPPKNGNPGDTLEYVFELVNTGNGKDEFVITSVEASVTAIAATLKDGNNRTGVLGYKQSVNRTVVAVIPQGMATTDGTAGLQLVLNARSEFNSSQEDINWTMIRVNHTYNPDLLVSPVWATLVPGQPAEFNVTVVNGGNGNDRISLNVTPQFDAHSWTVVLGQSSFSLAAGRNGTTVLEMIPPERALPGSYYINISALSSGPPSGPPGRLQILECQLPFVRGLRAPQLDFIGPEPLAAGEAVSFSLNFTNIGNVEESVDIAVVERPFNWGAIIDVPGNVRLGPHMLQRLNLTVRAPADRNESPPGKYFVRLRASNADLSEVLNFTFEVTRRPFNDLELVAVGPRDKALYPYLQPVHNFTFEVANTGDAVDVVRLTVGGSSSRWGTLPSGSISLGPGERRAVNLTVTVPVGTEGGRIYGLNLTASSENSAVVRAIDFSVIVVVIDLKLPEGSLTCLPRNAEVGTRVTLKVEVENRGSDAAQDISVAFFGPDLKLIGTRSLPGLSREDGPVSVELDWNGVAEGQNNVSVVVDPDNRIPESDEGNNRLSMVVTGYQTDLAIVSGPVFLRNGKTVDRAPQGSLIEVAVTVENLGNFGPSVQNVQVVLTDHRTGQVDISNIDRLPALGSVNVTFKLVNPKLGTHLISVKVNPDGIVREKTLDNNEGAGTLRVYEDGPTGAGTPFSVMAAVVVILVVVAAAAIALIRRRI